jgi:hypothetical protein
MPRLFSDEHIANRALALSMGKLFFIGNECVHHHQRRWWYANPNSTRETCESCEWDRKHSDDPQPPPLFTRIDKRRTQAHVDARNAARAAGEKHFYGDNCQMNRRHPWNQQHLVSDDSCTQCRRWLSTSRPFAFDPPAHVIHSRSTRNQKAAAWSIIHRKFWRTYPLMQLPASILSAPAPLLDLPLLIPPTPAVIPLTRFRIDKDGLQRMVRDDLFDKMPLLRELSDPLRIALIHRATESGAPIDELLLTILGDGIRTMMRRAALSEG